MRLGIFSVFAYFILVALLSPLHSWDSWEYHLPFSSFLWGIGGGSTTFHLSPQMQERFLGFPLAAELIQGFFWWATGTLNSVILPHLILFGLYLFQVQKVYKIQLVFMMLSFFGCPLLFIHFFSSYVDLFCGLSLALSFLFLNRIFLSIYEKREIGISNGVFFVLFLALAANTKYQGWLSAMLILLIFLIHFAFCKERRGFQNKLLFVGTLTLLLTNFPLIKNFLTHRNPFFPIRVEVGQKILFQGPEAPYKNPIGYLNDNPVLSFFVSSTELDWDIRGVTRKYTLDNSHTLPRTGGFGQFFFLLNLCFLLVQLFSFSRLVDPLQKLSVINISIILLGTSFFPQSHELRYWLYIPLILTPINLRYLFRSFKTNPINLFFIRSILWILFFNCLLSPDILKETKLFRWPLEIDTQNKRRALILNGMQEALDKRGIFCLNRFDLFKYSQASTGRKAILSVNERDCAIKAELEF